MRRLCRLPLDDDHSADVQAVRDRRAQAFGGVVADDGTGADPPGRAGGELRRVHVARVAKLLQPAPQGLRIGIVGVGQIAECGTTFGIGDAGRLVGVVIALALRDTIGKGQFGEAIGSVPGVVHLCLRAREHPLATACGIVLVLDRLELFCAQRLGLLFGELVKTVPAELDNPTGCVIDSVRRLPAS